MTRTARVDTGDGSAAGDAPHTGGGPEPRPPRARDAALATELAVVAAAGLVAFLHLRRAFHIGNDDLWQFAVAQEEGLSWELLGLNVFGHFAPVNRLLHLAFLEWARLDLTVGAVVAASLVALLALTVLWVTHELRLSLTRRLLVVGLTGFSIAVLESAVWTDAVVHIVLALIVTYAVLGAHLRGLTRGSAGWHALSVVLLVVGLLVQERPAFALPLVVLTDLLLVGAGSPWRRRVALLWSVRVPLGAMAAIVVAAAVLLGTSYAQEGGATAPVEAVGQTLTVVATGVLFPALVGVLPDSLPSVTAQWTGAVLLVGAALLLASRRRANAAPLAFVALTFLLYYGFLVFSPILFDDNVEWTALRLHNLVYVVVPVLLGLAHLRFGPAGAPAPGPSRRRWSAVAAVGVVAAVAVAGAVHVDRTWGAERRAHDYLQGVAAGRADWSRSDTTVLPLRAPFAVANSWATNRGRADALLPLYVPGWSPVPGRERTVVLDDQGRVQPVEFREETRRRLPEGPDGPGCLRSTRSADVITVPLDERVTGPALFVVLTYDLNGRPGQAAEVTPASGDGERDWTPGPGPVRLPADRSVAVLPLVGDAVRAVALWGITPGAHLCLREVRVVSPLYRVGGSCYTVDEYGARGARTPCRSGA